MYLKKHTTGDRELLAICDEDILNQTFTEKDLKITVNERFYKGEKVSEEEALEELKNSNNANLIGKKIIHLALKNNIIQEIDILYIQGIPYTLLFQL